MKVIKYPNGEYYLCRVRPYNRNYRSSKNKTYSNKFFPKWHGQGGYSLMLKFNQKHILLPKELAGKKVRFKLEVIENETYKGSISISENDN